MGQEERRVLGRAGEWVAQVQEAVSVGETH